MSELKQDRERIDELLRGGVPPLVERMLRDELRWVERCRRSLERRPVSCYAILHTSDGAATVRVRDLSSVGAGLELTRPPVVGARVQIEFPGLLGRPTVAAVVRHASDERAGVEFVRGGETAAKVAQEVVRCFGTSGTQP